MRRPQKPHPVIAHDRFEREHQGAEREAGDKVCKGRADEPTAEAWHYRARTRRHVLAANTVAPIH